MKRNDFDVGYGDDLEGRFASIYSKPGEDIVENSGFIKRIFDKFYIERSKEDEDYLFG